MGSGEGMMTPSAPSYAYAGYRFSAEVIKPIFARGYRRALISKWKCSVKKFLASIFLLAIP
jgi:hypothetical protein